MAENAIRYLLSKLGKLPDAESLQKLLDAKVNKSDVVNNLTSTDTDKPLSAAQGKALNESIDASTTFTKFTISHSGTWASAAVNGSTLYKYTVSVSKVSSDCPDIFLAAASGTAPTSAEQAAYGLLDHVTVDDSVPCLYLYAVAVPASDFVISVKGVA